MSGIFSNQELKNDIKTRFHKVESVEQFVSLLNFFERRSLSEESKKKLTPVSKKLLYHLSKTKNQRYNQFSIPKKNGNNRDIQSPDNILKRIQDLINSILQVVFENSSNYHSNGFLIGRDIRRNAIPHINKNYVLNLDIENFFPTINFRRVKVVLELEPFCLKGIREPISFLIANICTHNNSLPQGAPTSPLISNIVTQRLDRKLQRICNKRNIKYSRYADDLTFSSNKDILNEKFINEVKKIINQENFEINKNKTRLQNSMERQMVTGLVVNRKLNTKRSYLQRIRAMLNNWEKGGLLYAEKEFKKHQPPHKKNYDFREVLLGHLSFLKLVKGNTKNVDQLLLKYYFLYHQINYNHITINNVKNRLIKDNIKMEKLLSDRSAPTDEKFISFCTIAFHQIENLINYYYYRKYPVLENLLETLIKENPSFRSSNKNLDKAKSRFKRIRDLNIHYLVYLYEKEFYFDKNLYYDKQITKLREIRNDESHRCEVINVDKSKIKSDYIQLKDKIDSYKKRNKNYQPTNIEKKIISNYEVLVFLEKKNIKEARNTVSNVNKNIKNYFA